MAFPAASRRPRPTARMDSPKIRPCSRDEIEDAARMVHAGPAASGDMARWVAHRAEDAQHSRNLENVRLRQRWAHQRKANARHGPEELRHGVEGSEQSLRYRG